MQQLTRLRPTYSAVAELFVASSQVVDATFASPQYEFRSQKTPLWRCCDYAAVLKLTYSIIYVVYHCVYRTRTARAED